MSTIRNKTPRIVVGVDGSPSSRSALAWAVRQARLTGGTVEAVIAWQVPAVVTGFGWTIPMPDSGLDEIAKQTLAEMITDVAGPENDRRTLVRPLVVEGIPAQVLIDASADADLLVVGSRGHGGFAEALLGSVGQHCVQHAHCPVLITRGDTDD
jgi:nucleotide-binding universal stress UspA family protein